MSSWVVIFSLLLELFIFSLKMHYSLSLQVLLFILLYLLASFTLLSLLLFTSKYSLLTLCYFSLEATLSNASIFLCSPKNFIIILYRFMCKLVLMLGKHLISCLQLMLKSSSIFQA